MERILHESKKLLSFDATKITVNTYIYIIVKYAFKFLKYTQIYLLRNI